MIICIIANNRIVARPTDKILDGCTAGDGYVADQAADIGKLLGPQIDAVVVAGGAEIKGIDAARIIDGEGRSTARIDAGIGSAGDLLEICLLYTSPSPRDRQKSRMPSSA